MPLDRSFQSPKTGLCFSHFNPEGNPVFNVIKCFNPLKRVYAFLTCPEEGDIGEITILFQSPKTGLCFSHKEYFQEALRMFASI